VWEDVDCLWIAWLFWGKWKTLASTTTRTTLTFQYIQHKMYFSFCFVNNDNINHNEGAI